MTRVIAIVEGDGEVQALPVLVRRLAGEWGLYCEVPSPIRVHRDRFLNNESEFSSKLRLANAKAGPDGVILVLLDADDDCPVELAARVRQRAARITPEREVHVVLANREYEGWFLAAAESLAGERGLAAELAAPPDPDSVRDAKGWLKERMCAGDTYREVIDQPAFSARFSTDLAAERSRSFRKFLNEMKEILSV